jgi:anti-sigma factor RsiW
MKSPGCDEVRDHLPGWVLGELPEREAEEIRTHLSSCPDCREEEAVVRGVLHSRPPVPPELAGRIRARLRQELGEAPDLTAADPAVIPLPRKIRWVPAWALSAAALVILSLGIGVVWNGETPETTVDPMEVAVEEPLPEAWLWDDGIVAGAPTFDGLSDEELEALIQELEG